MNIFGFICYKKAVRPRQEYVTLEMEGQFKHNVEYTITCSVLFFVKSIILATLMDHPGVSKMVLVW